MEAVAQWQADLEVGTAVLGVVMLQSLSITVNQLGATDQVQQAELKEPRKNKLAALKGLQTTSWVQKQIH